MVSATGIVVDSRPVDESPGLCLTTQIKVCSVMLNRPVRTRLQGGVGEEGGFVRILPIPIMPPRSPEGAIATT
ncbi:MAG: hypothetical protein AAFQ89_25200 [Cyanobacteria bacterium J06626_18]